MRTTLPSFRGSRLALLSTLTGAILALTSPLAAHAGLTVNAAGVADGFAITTFATLPSSGAYGAWGSAVLSDGNVVVNGYTVGGGATVNYVFANTDGQTTASALHTSTWADGSYASSLARLGSVVYGTHYSDNTVRIVNLDGSEGAVVGALGRGGIAADAARNTLLVATDSGIQELNPTTGAYRYVGGSGSVDGVTVSADGSVVYGEQFGHIQGWNIATGVQVYDSGYIGSPDGVGIILSGALAGDLIVNDNGGILNLLDPTANTLVTIATGGSRGDYVGFDPSNGTLFLSQGDSLLRLSLTGGTIGSGADPSNGVPEPASWALGALGLVLSGMTGRKRRALQA